MITSLVTVAAETAIQALKEKTSRKSRTARKEVLKGRGTAKAVPRHQRFYTRRIAMKTVLIAVAASLATIFIMKWLRSRRGGK